MTFDPEQIETQLAEIQKQSSPTEARTVILNLLVISDEETRPHAERALGAVLGKRAARVIHIVNVDTAESDISLSARCYLDHERKSVCFQEVLIENGADGVGAAPGSWTPLLIRDIPVYALWLTGFGPHRALLDHVQEQADKLIIDSERAVASGDAAAEVHSAVNGLLLPEGFRLSDLTWQRGLPLRRATAHVFDVDDRADTLFELEAVELRGAPPMYGALYLGWIASRLGWAAAGTPGGAPETHGVAGTAGAAPETHGAAAPAARRLDYTDRRGQQVHTLHVPAPTLEAGLSVVFSFSGREPLRLEAAPGGCVSVAGTGEEETCEAFNVAQDGEMLLAEIDAARTEGLYLDAFDAARP